MTINFENYGEFFLSLHYANGDCFDYYDKGVSYSIKECMAFINYRMANDLTIVSAVLCDWNTGEVVAIIDRDNDDFVNDDDDSEWNDGNWDECGFDPYLGCYTDDC